MRTFLWIVIGATLLVVLRLLLIRGRFTSRELAHQQPPNDAAHDGAWAPQRVTAIEYGPVPDDLENFSQQASVRVAQRGLERRYDFLVATPRGLAAVLEKQHENAMMLNTVVVVERFDRDSIRSAVEVNLPRIIASHDAQH